MRNYPLLSPSEQIDLPRLLAEPTIMPAKFEDSTHQLWHCDTVDGPMVLKVCALASVQQSTFWYGLNALFGVGFPNRLGDTRSTAKLLKANGYFAIPEVIAAQDNHFVLTRFLAGEDVDDSHVTDADVVQLAQHIGQLHQLRFEQWGDLHAPQLTAEQWRTRLVNTLEALVKQSELALPASLLADILAQAPLIEASDFVPIMPDLRWDQLRRLENSDQLALIDLDAFVIGPRALELVLILYLLTPAQLSLFKQTYCKLNDWPDFAAQKRSYQLLLFLMNVLGETDLTRWMARV